MSARCARTMAAFTRNRSPARDDGTRSPACGLAHRRPPPAPADELLVPIALGQTRRPSRSHGTVC